MYRNLMLLAFVLALITLSAGVGYGPYRLHYGANPFDPSGDAAWKLEFLRRTRGMDLSLQDFIQNQWHATRGWTPVPNSKDSPLKETTNNRGHRGTMDYVYQPDKYTVVVLGDSFTWGAGAPDEEVWPALLQARDPRLHIVNLAVGGYGVDQMYVTLKEEIANYKPQLVIVAPIADDYRRSLLSFREFDKPRFVVDGAGALQRADDPIQDLPSTVLALRSAYPLWSGWHKLHAENRALLRYVADGGFQREWHALNTALLRDMVRIAREHGSETLLLHLATVQRGDPLDVPCFEEDLQAEVAAQEGCLAVPTRRRFLEADRDWTSGHYTLAESQFLVDIVYESLEQVEGWRAYKAAHPDGPA